MEKFLLNTIINITHKKNSKKVTTKAKNDKQYKDRKKKIKRKSKTNVKIYKTNN